MAVKIKNEDIQCVDYRYDEGIRGRTESNLCSTLTTKSSGYSGQPMVALRERESNGEMLRIRKLTPKETMRLMGFTDDDYQALKDIGLSDSAIYHCAGDSIITTCLVGIISPLVNNDDTHINIINEYVERRIIQQ